MHFSKSSICRIRFSVRLFRLTEGRSDGILYVNGVKLEDSPLKNHPLNPMWASYLPELMKEQSKYPVYVIDRNILQTKRHSDHGTLQGKK